MCRCSYGGNVDVPKRNDVCSGTSYTVNFAALPCVIACQVSHIHSINSWIAKKSSRRADVYDETHKLDAFYRVSKDTIFFFTVLGMKKRNDEQVGKAKKISWLCFSLALHLLHRSMACTGRRPKYEEKQ